MDNKVELDEKTLEEWRTNADCVKDKIRSAKRLIQVIDALRAARQELASTQSDLEFEKSERRSTTATLRERIAELEQRPAESEKQVVESQKAYNHQAHCAHLLSDELATVREQSQRDRERIVELEKFEKAINLMLTAVNPTIKRLAEKYLEGVESLEEFTKFLQTWDARVALAKEPSDA